MPLHDKYVVIVWKQYTGYLWETELINTIVDGVINVAYGLLSIIYSYHFVLNKRQNYRCGRFDEYQGDKYFTANCNVILG